MADKPEKARVNIYDRLGGRDEGPSELKPSEPTLAPAFRGPGFKPARESRKTAIGTKLDNDIVKRARDFCHANGITFASFLEVAIVDELDKQSHSSSG